MPILLVLLHMNIYRNTFFHWLETIEAFDEGDYANRLKRREEKWVHKKFSWNDHEYQLIHENQFENEYRMSYEAFHRLKEMMWVLLKRKRKGGGERDVERVLTVERSSHMQELILMIEKKRECTRM